MTERAEGEPGRIAGFMIEKELGRGGMAVVYLAERDGEKVALKVPNQVLRNDPAARKRFANEIQAHQKLVGRHFARMIDADDSAEVQWLAVEYVEGRTLFDVVTTNGPYTGMWLQSMAIALAEALVEMSHAAVVHRDITPKNIVTLSHGLKVIDFGIARIEDAASLTTKGHFFGVQGFCAPERYNGVVTSASDVFSWGACVTFAATGRGPFEGKFVVDEPSLEGVPAPLDQLVRQTLQKAPEHRPSAEEILATIEPGVTKRVKPPERLEPPMQPGRQKQPPKTPGQPETRPPSGALLRRGGLVALLALAIAALGVAAALPSWAPVAGPLGAGVIVAFVVLTLFGEQRRSSPGPRAVVVSGSIVGAAFGMVVARNVLAVGELPTLAVELATASVAAGGLLWWTHPK